MASIPKTEYDDCPPSQRHVLFLQGPPCDFFRRVGDRLESLGHRVSRINLCFDDWLWWHDARASQYRGRPTDWPRYIEDYLSREGVTDIVLLGERRAYHKEAIDIARGKGIVVTVTDFGYLRPDWITVRGNGMAKQNDFPGSPGSIRQRAQSLPSPELTPQYHDSSLRMALGDLTGSLGNVLFAMAFPFYRQTTLRPHPLIYFPAMGWRMLRNAAEGRRSAAERFEAFRRTNAACFIFPLQLDHDFQIRAYSPFKGMAEAIETVLESFARHAPAAAYLLVKTHPWDPGLSDWRDLIRSRARDLGIQQRVIYFNGGNLDAMIRHARGMVTVNSTSGLRAMQLGCPVKVLGEAVYDLPGMTEQGSLDAFWRRPTPPDGEFFKAFLRVLIYETQIRGVYFANPGKEIAIQAFAERLHRG